jgi:hypothetical protein
MPVTYEIDADRGLIRTRCIGKTTLREVIAHFAELRSMTSLPQPLDVQLDFTELTALPNLDQLEIAADSTASLTPTLKWGVLAIVVRDQLVYDTSRIYEALISHYFQAVRIFRDGADADAWLETVREEREAGSVGR